MIVQLLGSNTALSGLMLPVSFTLLYPIWSTLNPLYFHLFELHFVSLPKLTF